MSFSDEQRALLAAPLDRKHVKEREQGGRILSYVEGWEMIAEANRIFGFDRWTRETFDVMCVTDVAREIGKAKVPGWGVTYICRVRIVVDSVVVREGCGAGHGIDRDRGLAHESAIKEAETDAMKRALMTFGNPFGLALYDKEQREVADEETIAREQFIAGCKATIAKTDDPEKLRAWWASDAEKAARRKHDLSPDEVEMLKELVIAKLPTKVGDA